MTKAETSTTKGASKADSSTTKASAVKAAPTKGKAGDVKATTVDGHFADKAPDGTPIDEVRTDTGDFANVEAPSDDNDGSDGTLPDGAWVDHDGVAHPDPSVQAGVVGPHSDAPAAAVAADAAKAGDDSIDGATVPPYSFDDDANVKAAKVHTEEAAATEAFVQNVQKMGEAGYTGALIDNQTGQIITNGGTPIPKVPDWENDPKLRSSTLEQIQAAATPAS